MHDQTNEQTNVQADSYIPPPKLHLQGIITFCFILADNYHGFLFAKDGNTKAMPIYDFNGNLAGIQAAVSIKAFCFIMNESI